MVALALTVSMLLTAAPAAPPDPDVAKARAAFQLAQQLYKQARYLDAIDKFEEAYRLKPHPSIFFNIGRCYEQLGEITRALRSYRDYLKALPDAKDKDTVAEAIRNLERRMKENGRQQVAITTDPPGASITIDGTSYGSTPAYVELTPGNHLVKAALEGYLPAERNFVMSAERSMELAIALKAAPPPPPRPEPVVKKEEPPPAKVEPVAKKEPPADAPKRDPGAPAVGGPIAPPLVTADATAPAPRKRIVTWVVGGVAVAALGAGIGMGAASSGASNSMRASVRTQSEVQALHDQAQGLAIGANVSYGVAGAAAITAVILFFVEGRAAQAAAQP